MAPDRVERRILLLRGERVMLDADLAVLYDVEARSLVRAVKRNVSRFPADFMFQLTVDEATHLRSQAGILSPAHGGRRYLPYAFTEHGVAMLSSVLRSKRAVEINIAIMRTFVKLRRLMASNEELARRVDHHDQEIGVLFQHVQALLEPPDPRKSHPIGFVHSQRRE
jgi:hypothetical protein